MRAASILLLASIACAQSAPDLVVGRKIFESQCALCHGQSGGGGRGPGLNRPTLQRAPDDEALRSVISNGIPPEMPAAWQLHSHEIASVAAFVRSLGAIAPETFAGDPARGQAVYARSGCANCHIVSGEGTGFGPELTGVGARRNGSFLRQTLLDPTSTLADDFEYVVITPRAGAAIRGIRVNEDSFTIQVQQSNGRFVSFRKSEVDLRRLNRQTPMPSFKQLSTADLDDLVAWLAARKGKS